MTAGGNQFAKVQSGQRRILPANVWNAMLDTIDYVDALRESGGALVGAASMNVCIRPVKNNSASDMPRFGVMGIDSVLFTPTDEPDEFKTRPSLQGVTPALPAHFGKFCIAIEPIPTGQVGLAVFTGVSPVKVLVATGEEQRLFADVDDGVFGTLHLRDAGAAQILWREAGIGEKWAIVRLGTPQLSLRAFEIAQDCWPADDYARAKFLDDSTSTQYYLYPPMVTGETAKLYLGVGRAGGYGVPGTRGWAQWSFSRQRWEIVWGNFKLTALAKATYAIAKDSTGSMTVWWANLNTGVLESSTHTVTVRNAGGSPIPKDQLLEIWYDRQERQWFCIVAAGIQWARVQSGFTNASGAASRTVYVKACNWNDTDGSTQTGDQFNVSTPLKANADTALFTGYVVGYQTVGDGTNVIMTDCWDDPIGTIRAVGADAAVRDGWEELTDARSRFLVGRAGSPGDGAWGTYAATGGIALANLTQGLQDHPEMSQNCLGYGTAWKIHTKLNGSTGPLDHRVKNESSNPSIAPPWYAVKWIKRTS